MPGKPLIITSQLKVTNYPAYLGGGAQAEAIVDRLVKPCKIITLEGESKREAPKE
ncbi:MAG: ATP-binding protein [Succinatimonas hippei]|nr:ATP-binding protein [Succinatimonas hippei]